MNLNELVGSEKTGKTGTLDVRLKEGCSINWSLLVLGFVIKVLVNISQGN